MLLPNHVTNIIRARTEVIHHVLTEHGVDFERVIPMPENVIRHGTGHANIDGVYQRVYYPDTPDPDNPGKLLRAKPVPFPEGAIDWYEWSIEHWGTKWNAYETRTDEDDTIVEFETAWSHPFPVLDALSAAFPTEPMLVAWADEDLGSNFGAYYLLNSERMWLSTPEENTAAGADFACVIKYRCHYSDLDSDEQYRAFTLAEVIAHLLHLETEVPNGA